MRDCGHWHVFCKWSPGKVRPRGTLGLEGQTSNGQSDDVQPGVCPKPAGSCEHPRYRFMTRQTQTWCSLGRVPMSVSSGWSRPRPGSELSQLRAERRQCRWHRYKLTTGCRVRHGVPSEQLSSFSTSHTVQAEHARRRCLVVCSQPATLLARQTNMCTSQYRDPLPVIMRLNSVCQEDMVVVDHRGLGCLCYGFAQPTHDHCAVCTRPQI